MAALMKEKIIFKLRVAQVPEYHESRFIASGLDFPGSGRSVLTEGVLKTPNAGDINVVLKYLNKSLVVGNIRGKDRPEYKEKLLSYFDREADVWMRAGNHPNIAGIIGFMASFEQDLFPALIFSFCPLGDLRSYIFDHETDMSKQLKLQLLHDIACGLHHLHNLRPPIVHRDLRASNVILEANPSRITARINDFGSAKLTDLTLNGVYKSTKTVSSAWEPPEYIKRKTYLESFTNPKPSGDIWSFGCVFLEVMTGRDPWPTSFDIIKELEKGRHPPIPKDVEEMPGYAKLLKACWRGSAKSRPPIEEVITQLDLFIQSEQKILHR